MGIGLMVSNGYFASILKRRHDLIFRNNPTRKVECDVFFLFGWIVYQMFGRVINIGQSFSKM